MVQFCPNKVRRVSSATNQWIRNSIIVMVVDMEEVLIAGMQLWEMPCGRHSIAQWRQGIH